MKLRTLLYKYSYDYCIIIPIIMMPFVLFELVNKTLEDR